MANLQQHLYKKKVLTYKLNICPKQFSIHVFKYHALMWTLLWLVGRAVSNLTMLRTPLTAPKIGMCFTKYGHPGLITSKRRHAQHICSIYRIIRSRSQGKVTELLKENCERRYLFSGEVKTTELCKQLREKENSGQIIFWVQCCHLHCIPILFLPSGSIWSFSFFFPVLCVVAFACIE